MDKQVATKLLKTCLSRTAILRCVLPLLAFWAVASIPLQAIPLQAAPYHTHPQAGLALMPSPQAYKPGTPERTIAEFLAAWHDKDFTRMAQFTHLTWKRTDPNPVKSLNKKFTPIPILSAHIGGGAHGQDLPNPSENLRNINVTIHYRSDTGLHTKTVAVSVVRESRQFVESVQGTWGVDPFFTLDLDD